VRVQRPLQRLVRADLCEAPRDCPADRKFAACTDGAWRCVADVHWDPSTSTQERTDACGCAEGELLTKRLQDAGARRRGRTPACVPLGRCFVVKDCPQSAKVVQCMPTPENAYDTSNVCICNYGFGGGWESDCVCPPDRRQVRVKSKHATRVCLAPNECTRDRDCARGTRCALADGALIGTCEGG
jgi:hypothetical protein